VEEGSLPDGALDQLRALRPVLRDDVGLCGHEEGYGSVRNRPEDRLAPDDDDLRIVRDAGRGPDDVLKIAALQRTSCAPSG
jgi:hypothetical protein